MSINSTSCCKSASSSLKLAVSCHKDASNLMFNQSRFFGKTNVHIIGKMYKKRYLVLNRVTFPLILTEDKRKITGNKCLR